MNALFADYEPGPAHRGPRFDPRDVRPARVADVEAIAAISLARDGGDPEDVTRRIRGELDAMAPDGAWTVFVAEVDGAVVAYGRIRRLEQGDEPDGVPAGWHLTGVVVDPAHRRRGIAHALVEARLDWAAERTDTVYYFVNERNRPSIDLHAAFGFELVGPVAHARSNLTAEHGRLYRVRLSEGPGA